MFLHLNVTLFLAGYDFANDATDVFGCKAIESILTKGEVGCVIVEGVTLGTMDEAIKKMRNVCVARISIILQPMGSPVAPLFLYGL